MLDLNVELGTLIDELQRADVEFAVTGSLAESLHRGRGIQKSMDLMVWPEDSPSAENVARRLEFLQAGPLQPAQAGRYHLLRLIKMDEADILRLNLAAPASLVTATWLGACVTIPWRERTVKVTGRATIDALKRDAPWSLRHLALDVLRALRTGCAPGVTSAATSEIRRRGSSGREVAPRPGAREPGPCPVKSGIPALRRSSPQ